MTYPFLYKVNYFDEFNTTYPKVCGITFAEDYTQAMKNIESWYGDTIVEIESLFCLEDSTILEIPQTTYNILKKDDSKDFAFYEDGDITK